MWTPANGVATAEPARSQATAERKNQPRATGGTCSASPQPGGANQASPRTSARCGPQSPAPGQHPPDFAQQRDRVARHFEGMHQEHPIDGGIGEGQLELIDEGGK